MTFLVTRPDISAIVTCREGRALKIWIAAITYVRVRVNDAHSVGVERARSASMETKISVVNLDADVYQRVTMVIASAK